MTRELQKGQLHAGPVSGLTTSGDSAAVCLPDLSVPTDSLLKSEEGSPLPLCKPELSHQPHLVPTLGLMNY